MFCIYLFSQQHFQEASLLPRKFTPCYYTIPFWKKTQEFLKIPEKFLNLFLE